jgi:hypothetical protein
VQLLGCWLCLHAYMMPHQLYHQRVQVGLSCVHIPLQKCNAPTACAVARRRSWHCGPLAARNKAVGEGAGQRSTTNTISLSALHVSALTKEMKPALIQQQQQRDKQ